MLKAAVLILTASVAWRSLPAQGDSLSASSVTPQRVQHDGGSRTALADSAQPAMPREVVNYRRVYSAQLIVDGVPGMAYQYVRDQDLIDVLVTQYDPAVALRTSNDTIDLVRDDYTTAFDTLCTLAQQNAANLSWYVHTEDDLQIGKHRYRGYVFRYAIFQRPGGGLGCQGPPVRGEGWSYYQQTYALPQWLVRIRGHLQAFESLGNGALPIFSKSLIAAMVRDPGTA
jgi:hypothetical protein